jgi:exosortase
MSALGFTVLQNGNLIEIPGMTLEVAEVCSGFRKLIALGAFSLLYGYLFDIAPWKRAVLFLAAFPIALMANVIRISALIAVSSMWGEKALHIAHDWAEVFVLVIAFALYLLLGKGIGCKNLRF